MTYEAEKELFKLIDYYLSHDTDREEIANNGYELVTKRHTYRVRTKEMLEHIGRRLMSDYPKLAALRIDGTSFNRRTVFCKEM